MSKWLLRAQKVEVKRAVLSLVSECHKRFLKPENAGINGLSLKLWSV